MEIRDSHRESVESARKLKDEWLAQAHDSPIPHEIRHGFAGLDYFELDPAFRVTARLARLATQRTVRMATSKGVERDYLEYGRLEFELAGKDLALTAYKQAPDPAGHGHHHEHDREPERLFVPFRDATSGKESYGAARYLDVEEMPGVEQEIDFNMAYNPYCAYSPTYVCPFPPRENWLPVEVRAGEKEFAAGHG